jgi:glutathione-specific gamma-glutamylcyclotransferase
LPLEPHVFAHVPRLTDRIVDPERSRFRMTLATFTELDRKAREAGYPHDWRRSHEEREATRSEALAGRLHADLWVFGYGSLIWDPAIRVQEFRTAKITGFHRSFCLKSRIGRGSPEKPALIAALNHGGECHGLAFRIGKDDVDTETEILWMREMISNAYVPVFTPVDTPQGSVEALAFVINQHCGRYAPGLGPEETARIIATGEGILGANREYLFNLVEHLGILGIDDEELRDLHRRVRAIESR